MGCPRPPQHHNHPYSPLHAIDSVNGVEIGRWQPLMWQAALQATQSNPQYVIPLTPPAMLLEQPPHIHTCPQRWLVDHRDHHVP
ncbi:hypothetical protein Acr_06g0008520 [Actinidia rufa]|uniref:Uncharacterized protein n=1 Tax=Actinidia rufa TaxID=165716 RepID=A0A7J0ERE8_9ERIC|nr:hypothetical protein Acr_06g0008520 [Actinidia rufa]